MREEWLKVDRDTENKLLTEVGIGIWVVPLEGRGKKPLDIDIKVTSVSDKESRIIGRLEREKFGPSKDRTG